jgi:hypothetical protein
MTSPTLEQRAEDAAVTMYRQQDGGPLHIVQIRDWLLAFARETAAAELDALEEWANERDDWRRLRELYPELCCGSACTEAAWAFGLVVAQIMRRRTALAPKGTEP